MGRDPRGWRTGRAAGAASAVTAGARDRSSRDQADQLGSAGWSGGLAEDDAAAAVAECDAALAGWGEIGAPYETAVVRLVLAEAERAMRREVRAQLEEGTGEGSADDAGPVLDAQARAAYQRRLAEIDEALEL